jgi:hypothetical protein
VSERVNNVQAAAKEPMSGKEAARVAATGGSEPAGTAGERYDREVVRALSDREIVRRLEKKISERAPAYFPDTAAGEVSVRGQVWGGQETARTFRFEVRSRRARERHVLFVKLCPIFESLNPSLLEYETLQQLHPKMLLADNKCAVSRPLDFYPELNAYAMESAGTNTFRSYLLKNNSLLRKATACKELHDKIAGVAVWLKTFHQLTATGGTVPFQATPFIKSISEDYDYHSIKKFNFRPGTIALLDSLLAALSSLDSRHDMPCAKWHWDFTPGHVYVDKGRISVIDILGMDNSPIFEDIGRFLAAMATVNNLPFYPLFDHRRANAELCDRFIESYASGTNYDLNTFTLFSNIFKLKYLLIWFCGQNHRVSTKIHPLAGRIFSNIRLVRLFEPSLLSTAKGIAGRL